MTATRILVGPRDATAAPGAILSLALRLRAHALAVGLVIRSFETSRIRCSDSRYLRFADRLNHEWIVRIASHYKPRKTGHLDPHLDLVSRDGVSGFPEACLTITRIACGEHVWEPPVQSPKRRGQR